MIKSLDLSELRPQSGQRKMWLGYSGTALYVKYNHGLFANILYKNLQNLSA